MHTLNEVPLVSVSSCDTVVNDNAGKLKIGKGAWLNLMNVARAKTWRFCTLFASASTL